MSFNGSGVFVRLYNWANDAAANIKIRADRMDNEMNGMATGLSTCITKDGQTTIIADLPMAGYKHTGVGAASSGTDYARADQLLASTYCGTSSGTNTVTATVPIGGSFNAAGKIVSFKAGGTNTGTTTFNGVTVQKLGQALEAGDITTGDIVYLEHDGTNCQMLSPARFPVLANYSIKGLTLDKTVFTALTSASPALGDTIPFGDVSDFDGIKRTTISSILSLISSVSRNFIDGYQMSTAGSSTTMTIGAGQSSNSTNDAYITLASSIAKTTGSWVVGSGNGGLDTGTIANDTSYHFYAIRRPDTGVVDVCFSASGTSPTFGGAIPSAYTQYRVIGSDKTNGSGQWVRFFQEGDNFVLDVSVEDVAAINPGASAVTRTLASIPTGRVLYANIQTQVYDPSSMLIASLVTSLDKSDETPVVYGTGNNSDHATFGVSASVVGGNVALLSVKTNTSAQVRSRLSSSNAGTLFSIRTRGWVDKRGKE